MSLANSLRVRPIPKRSKNDRRQATRFALSLPVRYSLTHGTGWGEILNISSSGTLLTIRQPAGRGELVELNIGWPVLLDERVHLRLVARGTVVRVEGGRVAVKFERCDLRTSSSSFVRQAILPASRVSGESQSSAMAAGSSQG